MEIEGPLPAPADAHPLPAVQGSAGTTTSLVLRTIQAVAAAFSIAAMISADDYSEAPAFTFLVGAAAVEVTWSCVLVVLDLEMLLKDGPKKHWFLETIKFLDVIVGGTMFGGASASCGIWYVIRYDFKYCWTDPCTKFEMAITRAYVAFAALVPCCLANWLNWLRSVQAMNMKDRTDCTIIILTISLGFAIPSIAMGAIVNCFVPNIQLCTPTSASGLLLMALILQISGGTLELIGYGLAGYFAPTAPGSVPDWPLTCTLLIAIKWLFSVFTLGTACATLGLEHLFIINDIYKKSTNILGGIFCFTSLVTGLMSVLSSSFSTHSFLRSYLRRGPGQQ